MTYNIFWGKYGLDDVAEVIRNAKPDAVLLQEVDRFTERCGGEDQFERLRSTLGWNGVFAPAHRYADGVGVHGLAILSPHPLFEDAVFPLAPVPGHKDRALLRARLEWHAKTISLYSTHLVAWWHGRGTARKDREAQAAQIRAILAEDPHFIVLGGDLNMSRRAKAFEILAADALVDAWDSAGVGLWGATSYSFFPLLRIDHLLVDRRLRILRAFVVRSLASDHYPVIADLQF
ncbi:MAG: endonuclease/exonuclease/phosphatase family protein [Nitrospirae bacterium]|nr:endonuclease/exonuclease/phosphatase family protein [Nitrospirota bacterium]